MRYLDLADSLSRRAIASSGVRPRIGVRVATVWRRVSGVSWSGAATRRSRWTVVARTTVPRPVEDIAALARRVDGDRRLGDRLIRQPLAVDDLPVAETRHEGHGADAEDEQQEEESAP